jgi:hypothetical protein
MTRNSALESESLLIGAVAQLLQRAGSWKTAVANIAAPLAIQRAHDYLQDHLFVDISLDRLASVSELSKFHLLRQFRAEFGFPAFLPIAGTDHTRQKPLKNPGTRRSDDLWFRRSESLPSGVPVPCGNDSRLLCGAISFKTPNLNTHTLHMRRGRLVPSDAGGTVDGDDCFAFRSEDGYTSTDHVSQSKT